MEELLHNALNKIEEDVQITIKELPPQQHSPQPQQQVKDIKLRISLVNSTLAVETTELINGELEGLIIESDNIASSILINLEDYPEVELLNIRNFKGSKFFAIRNEIVDKNNSRFNYGSTRFILNDRLRIVITGVNNTTVNLLIRYR